MTALLTRWRRVAITGLVAGGLMAGSALAVPAEAAKVKNLVGNGSAEAVSRQVPSGWAKRGGGVNARTLSSVTGDAANGRKFVRTKITKFRSGSAWWLTPVTSVRGGSTYTYGEAYRSGRPTTVYAFFTVGRKVVGKKVAGLAPARRWTSVRYAVTVPVGATRVRFGHALASVGVLDVDAVSLALGRGGTPPATAPGSQPPSTSASAKGLVSLTFDDGWLTQLTNAAPIMNKAGVHGTFYLISSYADGKYYMTTAQAKRLQGYGNEIGSHTVSHVDVTKLSPSELTHELADSKKTLEVKFGPVTSFAYPYGATNKTVEAEVAKYYTSARSTNSGFNAKGTYDKYALRIGYVLQSTTAAEVQTWLDQAKAKNSWLILCYHKVQDGSSDTYATSIANFQAQIDAVKKSGIPVVTVRDGLQRTS